MEEHLSTLAPDRGGTSRRRTRRTTALLVPLAAVLIAAGCNGDDLGGQAVARVMSGDLVEVASGSGWTAVDAGAELPDGARVRTGDDQAHLAFRSGEVRLAPQAAAVVGDNGLDLLRGEVLVMNRDGFETRWTDVEVDGEGVYRLAPGLAPRLAVYRGEVTVRRPSEVRTVPELREASLSARRLPASAMPLTYRHDDPWDRMLLQDAIAFDDEAARLTRGLASEYGVEPRSQDFYASFAAAPDRTVPVVARTARVREPGGRFGPPGEALLTMFVAQSAAAGRGPEALADVVEKVVDLRSAGARWGLVATELDVTTSELADVVDAGRQRRLALLEQQAAASSPADPGSPSDSGSPAAQPSGGSPPPAPPPSGSRSGNQPSAPAPAPSRPAPAPEDPSPQPQPNPTDPLGEQPPKGTLESVIDLILSIP